MARDHQAFILVAEVLVRQDVPLVVVPRHDAEVGRLVLGEADAEDFLERADRAAWRCSPVLPVINRFL